MNKVLFDTNLLVYAATIPDEAKHAKAINAMEELTGQQRFCVGAQNLAEFCRVMGEKVRPIQHPDDIRQWVRTFHRCGDVFHYSGASVLSALAISAAEGIHFYDALIVAVMRENGVGEIWTEDTSHFSKVRGLKCRNPLK
ncbi:MAG: PIN domain-containing protein [Candidatus Micrarchaeota archaeon]